MSGSAAPELVVIPNGSFGQNTVLVIDPESREAVMIDPGEEHARILAAVRHRQLDLKAIWLTHAHIDHIWGTDEVRAATGAPVWLHPDDRRWYDSLPEQGRMFGLGDLSRLAPPDHELTDGGEVSIGRFRFTVRHVPGHSPGHVAFIGHGLCLSGDVLFQGSIGRTDQLGGDPATLMQSIREVLLPLPDDTRVIAGHGPDTTIGAERAANPYLQGLG